jgi:hypothetical protein
MASSGCRDGAWVCNWQPLARHHSARERVSVLALRVSIYGRSVCIITVGPSMNPADYSGELRCGGDVITYHSAVSEWAVPIADVRLIAEYTNSDGPYLDDYFLVFLTAPEGGWHEASFYAKGRDEALAALSTSMGAPLQCGLCNSTVYKTRIMWPPQLKDQELMEVLPPKRQSLWQKLTNSGARDLRLSAAAHKAFEK